MDAEQTAQPHWQLDRNAGDDLSIVEVETDYNNDVRWADGRMSPPAPSAEANLLDVWRQAPPMPPPPPPLLPSARGSRHATVMALGLPALALLVLLGAPSTRARTHGRLRSLPRALWPARIATWPATWASPHRSAVTLKETASCTTSGATCKSWHQPQHSHKPPQHKPRGRRGEHVALSLVELPDEGEGESGDESGDEQPIGAEIEEIEPSGSAAISTQLDRPNGWAPRSGEPVYYLAANGNKLPAVVRGVHDDDPPEICKSVHAPNRGRGRLCASPPPRLCHPGAADGVDPHLSCLVCRLQTTLLRLNLGQRSGRRPLISWSPAPFSTVVGVGAVAAMWRVPAEGSRMKQTGSRPLASLSTTWLQMGMPLLPSSKWFTLTTRRCPISRLTSPREGGRGRRQRSSSSLDGACEFY